ncbi:1-phosphofructokinase family hexose kinase [Rhizomonospora bruguierae]|uniref:1-phosphofructokinase family hexose kinase n=1 Tax=Rhizomonospora bruguierae TaxID=1581705 RepID=UPI001BCA8DA6|nr:PfkB family carbohydrate kinase [Micromonospora sp. NBRC 107566]
MVFTPAPLLTVTVEQRGDTPDIHLHAGGQGVWQARMIHALGVPVVMCAALGGEIGRVLGPLIEAEGIRAKGVLGESRNGAYVHDRRGGEREEIADAPGQPLTRHELDELYGLALAEGLGAAVSVLSGPAIPAVVPPDTYRRLAHDLCRNGCQVVADLSGEYLEAVVHAGIRLLKVSHEELVASGRTRGDSRADLIDAMHRLHSDGARSIVVSRAELPALALLDGQVVEVEMPALEPADHRGAGDSMTAGAAAVLARGGDMSTAIRHGAAAGALNVTRHGLGTGRADVIDGLVERVALKPVTDGTVEPCARTTPNDLANRARQG